MGHGKLYSFCDPHTKPPFRHSSHTVLVTHHLPVGVGDVLNAVPAVIRVFHLEGVGSVFGYYRSGLFNCYLQERDKQTKSFIHYGKSMILL